MKNNIKPILDQLLISEENIIQYGHDKAKLMLHVKPQGKLVLVTAITPTLAGEGKTTVSIGLIDGLAKLGVNAIGSLREPSLGPVFGQKGGATGGGKASLIPDEEINMHFTGDLHAITSANNLISATIDNHIYFNNELELDVNNITWQRCLDMNDRELRDIKLHSGRNEQFTITAASEMMAIFCIAKNEDDFTNRINQAIIGYTVEKEPRYVKDLNITNAIIKLMKSALLPNIVQTLEHNPVIVHGGPFANIAHGCSSVIGTNTALGLGDYVVTEAGFGSDLGAEKFMNIKVRKNGLNVSAIVLVVTIRALKLHGGQKFADLSIVNPDAVKNGLWNLEAHLCNISKYNVPFVVSINNFSDDSASEKDVVIEYLKQHKINYEECSCFAEGGNGAVDLAKKVISIAQPSAPVLTYELSDSIETKIEKVVNNVYGGKGVNISEKAKQKLDLMSDKQRNYPICIAKTPLSLSDDIKTGNDKDFIINVTDVKISNGAEFVIVYAGNIMTMPGLPKVPKASHM